LRKKEIKVLLDEYSKEKEIKSVSSSSIGRIIKRYKTPCFPHFTFSFKYPWKKENFPKCYGPYKSL